MADSIIKESTDKVAAELARATEIRRHNAEIDMRIEELNQKKRKYEDVISQASALESSYSELSSDIFSTGTDLREIIICGSAVDDGSFGITSVYIDNMIEDIEKIIKIGERKIEEINTEINRQRSQKIYS